MANEHVVVHVNSRYVDSEVHDLDVYDSFTLDWAIRSLAGHVNYWHKEGQPEKAEPYVKFKNRIKAHMGRL